MPNILFSIVWCLTLALQSLCLFIVRACRQQGKCLVFINTPAPVYLNYRIVFMFYLCGMKRCMWLLIPVIILAGCEKDINLSINNNSPLLVVDASIENGQPPFVALSSSLNFFSTISPAQLAASFVHGAQVTVTDGSNTAILKEYSVTDTSGYAVYYYTLDSSGAGGLLAGALNKQYTLTIKTGNTTYTAATSIPTVAKTLDSLWWKKAPNNKDTNRCVLFGRFTDPKGLGNYIRYFTKTNSQRFLPGRNSVFDDQFTDGSTYDLQFDVGTDKNAIDPDREDAGYAHRGDTVTVKFCNIDKASYDFWRTWEFAYQSNDNPFSSPVKVLGNISNGALGAFTGYAAEYKTIVIPK